MDFDDLDELEEAQAPTKPVYQPKEYIPPIHRSFRMPDFDRLPSTIIDNVIGQKDLHTKARPKVCIRAFVFYGAGDAWYQWAELAARAPDFCEIAIHEWPSHGEAISRGEEAPPKDLDALAEDAYRALKPSMEQHAEKGRIEGAPFALIGHSIGCLVVTVLAKLLKDRLKLEPAAMIMLDRAAPHLPLHSEYGQKMRKEDPDYFLQNYVYTIHKAAEDKMKIDPEKAKSMKDMWLNDIPLASDTRDVGFHAFECDVLVLRAMQNFVGAWAEDDWPDEQKAWHKRRDEIMGSPPGCNADFSVEQFEEWKDWVKEPAKLIIKDVDTTHMGVKSHAKSLELIWDFLKEKKAPDPPKDA